MVDILSKEEEHNNRPPFHLDVPIGHRPAVSSTYTKRFGFESQQQAWYQPRLLPLSPC